jgi:hypothetical protein
LVVIVSSLVKQAPECKSIQTTTRDLILETSTRDQNVSQYKLLQGIRIQVNRNFYKGSRNFYKGSKCKTIETSTKDLNLSFKSFSNGNVLAETFIEMLIVVCDS